MKYLRAGARTAKVEQAWPRGGRDEPPGAMREVEAMAHKSVADTIIERLCRSPDEATFLRIANTILNSWNRWEAESGQEAQLYQDPEAEHECMLFSIADAIRDGLNESTQHDPVADARQKQSELCAREGLPHFAPSSGHCFRCGRQIYEGPKALSGGSLVTGCPYCCYSFCE